MRAPDGWRLLSDLLRPQRKALLRLAAWSSLEALPAFLSGIVIARALDRGFLADRPLVGFGWLAALAALWTIGAVGTRQVYPWLAGTVEPLRDALVTALITGALRRAVAGEAADGSTVAQATVQVETVRGLVSALLRDMRQLLTAGVAALGGLAVLSPWLALVVGSFVLLSLALFTVLIRVLFARYRAVVLCEERVTALAAPLVEGVRDVVAAGAEARAAQDVGEAIDAEAEANRAFARARLWRLPVVALGAQVPLLALLAVAPWLLEHEHLTVGQVVGAAFYLFSGLEPAIQLLVNAGGTILVNLGVVLGRMAEICKPSHDSGEIARESKPASHHFTLQAVTFAYSPYSEPVVSDLSLEICEGEHLAVVGPSGIGKSTLAHVLVRLVTPQRGELRLGGTPLEQIDDRHLRRTVTLIPQEAYVFTGTVRENLTYLNPDASRAQLDAAVAAVGLEELMSRLGGYDAEIRPCGGGLSPGERQLLALGRTYLSPAAVVVLDEATCHLDPVAEACAERAFTERPGTVVVIAHRISSALRADRILVMDGAVPLIGTHTELLRCGGLYAELVGHWNGVAGADPAILASSGNGRGSTSISCIRPT